MFPKASFIQRPLIDLETSTHCYNWQQEATVAFLTCFDLESEIQNLILDVVYKNWSQVAELLKRPAAGWTRNFVDATTPRPAQVHPSLSPVCTGVKRSERKAGP